MKFDKEKNNLYKAVTNNIEVTVRPEYMISQSNMAEDLFIWAYHVNIKNKGQETIRVISRYWKIIDEVGGIQEVSGEGVVGEQPFLEPGSNFHYSSGIHLNYSSGIMSGYYVIKNINSDEVINVKIPTFSLDIPNIKEVVN